MNILNIKKHNKQTYNALAEQYALKSTLRSEYNEGVILKFVPYITTGKKILDIGCAVGLDVAIFTHLGFTVSGIDISDEMVGLAKKRNPGVNIIAGDFMETAFDNPYDGIFAQSFIHLYPKAEVESVFKKIKSLLVTNGVAHITTSKSAESKEGFFIKDDYTGKYTRFRKFWTKQELKDTLMRLNFSIANYYETTDPFNKTWMVFIVRNE